MKEDRLIKYVVKRCLDLRAVHVGMIAHPGPADEWFIAVSVLIGRSGRRGALTLGLSQGGACAQMLKFCQPASQLNGRSHRMHERALPPGQPKRWSR
jgi:hypothetical protein